MDPHAFNGLDGKSGVDVSLGRKRQAPGSADLDLHLIFPPQWSPFQPFLSTASLKAHLDGLGYNVLQSDWNLDFYRYFLGRPRLERAIARLRSYIAHSRVHDEYRLRCVYALGVLNAYNTEFELVERLQDPQLLSDVGDFRRSVRALGRLLDAFSLAEPIVEVGTSSLSTGDVLESFPRLHRFLGDNGANPFVEFFEQQLAAVEEVPEYFGISVIGGEQVVPGLTLGALLKKKFPETPVIVGGSVFSRIAQKGEDLDSLFERCFDAICLFEGERPLEMLLASDERLPNSVPNIVLRDSVPSEVEICSPLGANDVPTPTFDGLPIPDYLSPVPVLPVLATRGCYWGKCAFCYHGMIYGERYRGRKPELVATDLETLRSRYGVTHFAFNDEAIPPKYFRRLPEHLPSGEFAFTALYKFEPSLKRDDFEQIARVGFKSLYIGLESASERVQKHMVKNNLRSTMLSNLRDAAENEIWSHCFAFFGFPTETPAEARETADFLLENTDIIDSEGTGTFSLEHDAPISLDATSFGVASMSEKPNRILELYYDYETTSGLSADEALEMVDDFAKAKEAAGAYQHCGWIPREHLLVLLARYGRSGLRSALADLDVSSAPELRDLRPVRVDWFDQSSRRFVVDIVRGKLFEGNSDLLDLFEIELGDDLTLTDLAEAFPRLREMAGTR